jgi:hypothetical protein
VNAPTRFAIAAIASLLGCAVAGAALGIADSVGLAIPDGTTIATVLVASLPAFIWASRGVFASKPELTRAVLRGAVTVGAVGLLYTPGMYLQIIAYLLSGGHE